MGWTLRNALYRTGLPAAAIFLLWTVRDLACREPTESVSDVVVGNGGLLLIIWLAAAAFWYAVTRIVSRAKGQKASSIPR